jgi:hypothetical protein
VTVVAPSLARADAYATAAFAMGARGPAWTARLHGCEALTVLADGEVLSTPGLERLRVPLRPAAAAPRVPMPAVAAPRPAAPARAA